MSGHADTIRAAEQASIAMQEERVALLAENQRLREERDDLLVLLRDVEVYLCQIDDESMGPLYERVSNTLAAAVCEALAGDEEPTEGYIIPEGDERCGYEIDACRCMRRKGHDGLHGCAHGDWGDRHARAPEDLIGDPNFDPKGADELSV